MKYILISVIDREIYTEQFDDLDYTNRQQL